MYNNLEKRVEALSEQLSRFKRDNAIAMENIERSNLSKEIITWMSSVERRLKSLEEHILSENV